MKQCFLVAALSLRLLGAVAGTPDAPWFGRALVGIEVGPTGARFGDSDSNDVRYCARFDGREIVRHALAAHGGYLVLWARDGDVPGPIRNAQCLNASTTIRRQGDHVALSIAEIHEVLILRY